MGINWSLGLLKLHQQYEVLQEPVFVFLSDLIGKNVIFKIAVIKDISVYMDQTTT